ncbi:MAG: hypothetical protein IJ717_13115 [Treponema sp.]|nr:hypothetical protein [Treponema sp.]
MPFRTASTAISIFLLLISSAFSTALDGKKLSDDVYETVKSGGFKNIVKSNIATTGRDEFAYNIILNFSADKAESNTENEEQLDRDSYQKIRRTSMILDFVQKDVIGKEEEFIDLLKTIESTENRNTDVTVIFSALDDSTNISGTEVFADGIDDTDTTFSIVVKFDDMEKSSILTGNVNRITPLWLTRQITDAFIRTDQEFEIGNNLASLYRLGILKGDERMGSFIKNNIPAVAVKLRDDERNSGFDFLKNIVSKISVLESGEWDTHYIFLELRRPFKPVWIDERIFLLSCVAVMTLSLLLLCGFSFIGESGARYKRDFIRSWYMIPITIGISVFTMIAGQWLLQSSDALRTMNPIYQFGGKMIFSTMFISATFLLQEQMKLPIATFVYGYVTSIVATINMFLFSSVDITFFVIFGIEYLLIHFSRPAKRIPFVAFWAVLMFAPFVPFAYSLVQEASVETLSHIVFCSWQTNVALAFAIFPFEMMWQKILVRVNIMIGMKGLGIVKATIAYMAAILVLLLAASASLVLIKKFFYVENVTFIQKATVKTDDEEKYLSMDVLENEFLGMNTNHIRIRAKKEALRYSVKIRGFSQTPIYESTYDYYLSAENEATFKIPDFPPELITIDYAADTDTDSEIEVSAIFDEDGELFKEIIVWKNSGEKKGR